jgi:hypothetical protein
MHPSIHWSIIWGIAFLYAVKIVEARRVLEEILR